MKLTPSMGGAYSGSLGGIVASHNRGGPYFRRRAVPTNPNSDRQAAVRSLFTSAVQSWQETLTDAQRQGWRDYAAGTPRTNTLGQALVLTGQQAYVASFTALSQAGMTAVADAPTILDTGLPPISVTRLSVDALDTTLEVAGAFAEVPDGTLSVAVYIGRPVSPAVTFFKGPYQLGRVLDNSTNNPWFVDAEYATGEWSADIVPLTADIGKRYPLRVRTLYADGRISAPLEVIVPLTATPGP